MAEWVTPTDVLDRWINGSQPDENSKTLAVLIDDAEDAVLMAFPDMQDRIDSLEMPLNRLKRVIAGVVIRVYKIGQEYRASYSETTGPFSHSGSVTDSNPRNITLTDEELRTLAPKRSTVFSVSMAPRMRSPYVFDEGPWVRGSGDDFPY